VEFVFSATSGYKHSATRVAVVQFDSLASTRGKDDPFEIGFGYFEPNTFAGWISFRAA
jgi:hypothetical protein